MNVREDRRGYRFAAEITFAKVSGKALNPAGLVAGHYDVGHEALPSPRLCSYLS